MEQPPHDRLWRPPFPGPWRGTGGDLASRVREACAVARDRLLSLQRSDGHWCAELEGDTILESEYILTLHFLGLGRSERAQKTGDYLLEKQLPGGGWPAYPGGPPEVSASVKACLALQLSGHDPRGSDLRRARRVIVELGGLDACNSFTRILLAIFGQYEWRRCPAIPPEIVLMPRWSPFHLYEMSAWSRAIFVPLSIVWALKPHCAVPPGAGVDDLRAAAAPPASAPSDARRRAWAAFFRTTNAAFLGLERLRLRPLRRRALARAESWILCRLEKSDGLGAIFPPIVNTLFALRALGYPLDHPVLAAQLAELEKLVIEEEGTARVQPCFSPVWDTAQALNALADAGLPSEHPALQAAARWLLDHEVRVEGDWKVKNPGCPTGGWYFEYANEFYPDCDDTAQVLTALSKVRFREPEDQAALEAARERGLAWLLAMQNRDGGWASFDRGCDREVLTYVPFADHNAMIDPSTTDITGRALETLAALGFGAESAARQLARRFVFSTQEEDGSWYGRWGCNYLYGTWLALWGLAATGGDGGTGPCRRAAEWIRACQNPDGGWGELPLSYSDPRHKGRGPSTAAQTSWALLGLLAAGDGNSPAVRRGIERLLATQEADGGWTDEPWTGTGFPEVFYLRYHLYATYFPLLALAAWGRRLDGEGGGTDGNGTGPIAAVQEPV